MIRRAIVLTAMFLGFQISPPPAASNPAVGGSGTYQVSNGSGANAAGSLVETSANLYGSKPFVTTGTVATAVTSSAALDFFGGNGRLLMTGANSSTAAGFQVILETQNGESIYFPLSCTGNTCTTVGSTITGTLTYNVNSPPANSALCYKANGVVGWASNTAGVIGTTCN